jgi:molybdopterin synthase catalytic subunit
MEPVTRSAISAADLVAAVASSSAGGTAVFLGTVRQGPEDGPIASIEYSAYEAMVKAEWARIVAEAQVRWPGGRFAVQHRVGLVPLGEASIGVAAAMPHRAEAFAACQWIVDEAKSRLPVWKKERFVDGHYAWREEPVGASRPRHG